jgi:hypothetical protein
MEKFNAITSDILTTYYANIQILKKCNADYDNFIRFFHNYLLTHFPNITFNMSKKILLLLINNHTYIKKYLNLMNYTFKKCNRSFTVQTGGFLFNTYDTIYTKVLNIIDVTIAAISIFPTQFISDDLQSIVGPYQLISLFLNLSRGDYMLAFYSFISLIPGLGSIIGGSLKIMHMIIRYMYEKEQDKIKHKYLDEVEQIRIIHKMIANYDPTYKYTKYESLNSLENEELLMY